jgi:DNA repair exonuclease SbcCD ATPase subunit
MRKIKYKTLKIKDFLSIGKDTLNIDFQSGLNLITGNNIDNPERRNGTGKSAIIEAFYYALFGTTIRDIKKEFVINNVTKGKGRIELVFDVATDTGTNTYKVIRQLKPSTVELYKCGDEDEDIAKDSISNTNKYICELIGSNPVICKSCDILSLSDNTPFMGKKPEEKRKFIEDIFTLEIFGKMLKDLKEEIRSNKGDISISIAKIEEMTKNIVMLQGQYDAQLKEIEERDEILQAKKLEVQSKIDAIDKELDTIEHIDTVSIEEENVKLNDLWTKIDGKLANLHTAASDLQATRKIKYASLLQASDIGGVACDKCLQDISHEHTEFIEARKVELQDSIEELNQAINANLADKTTWDDKKTKVRTKIAKNNETIQLSKTNENKRSNLNISRTQYIESLTNLEDDENSLSGFLASALKMVEDSKTRVEEETKHHNNLKEIAEDLEVGRFILGEEGIKSFIIKRLLDMLNSSIQKYINALGMTMRCKFDEYFDEKITNDKGKDISYWNFSGGERRTVDLACAWAFKDIKKKISGVSSNVEFMDEIFDSAFDERGLDLLIEVLKDRIDKNGLSCYAISHRKETLKHVDGEIVNVEKENGVTRRIA